MCFQGLLTLHGQTRNVEFHYTAELVGGTYSVNGDAQINIEDFGMRMPSYLGVTVRPLVSISTAFQAENP